MAYLFENKELVYEKQMRSLKQRIILVNTIIFITNFLATIILIFNRLEFYDFLQLVVPVFILNLVISYAMIINRDSHEQLYLAMYTSIIGIIVVVINIFMVEKTPATYLLIYLAIPIISIYKDKKAVGLGYIIILFFSTIIHFKHTNYIVGLHSVDSRLTPLLYEALLIITLIVQSTRTFFNETEIDNLYDELDSQKEIELKYHHQLFNLLSENNRLIEYTDHYIADETVNRLNKFIDLFNSNFYIKEDLKEKLEFYLKLQQERDVKRVLGRKMVSYQLKKEINQFDEMSLYKQSKLQSYVLRIKNTIQQNKQIESIKNFESIFIDPDMSIEMQIIGFILLYDHLRINKILSNELTHEEIVSYFKNADIHELFDKEILDFFLGNTDVFNDIYNNIEEQTN